MLYITIPKSELYDEETSSFIQIKEQKLQLEHSLVSLSKWEQKTEKPFLSTGQMTFDETIEYIKCMTITQNVDPIVYLGITNDIIRQVDEYIGQKMTATTFSSISKGGSRQIITSEIIYYWMFELNIPKECEKWHLNRLLTMIRVSSEKNSPHKKMTKGEIMARNKQLNDARKRQLNTKG